MKCPVCGVWSNVLETRPIKDGVKRRRECANMHRFTTHEMESADEVLTKCFGRSVFDWMLKLLNGKASSLVQPRQGNLFEGKSQQADHTEEVLKNIFNAIDRSKDEKR